MSNDKELRDNFGKRLNDFKEEYEKATTDGKYEKMQKIITANINKSVKDINDILYKYALSFYLDVPGYDRTQISFYLTLTNSRARSKMDTFCILNGKTYYSYNEKYHNEILDDIYKSMDFIFSQSKYKSLIPNTNDYSRLAYKFCEIFTQLEVYKSRPFYIFSDGFLNVRYGYHVDNGYI